MHRRHGRGQPVPEYVHGQSDESGALIRADPKDLLHPDLLAYLLAAVEILQQRRSLTLITRG